MDPGKNYACTPPSLKKKKRYKTWVTKIGLHTVILLSGLKSATLKW